MLEVKVDFTYQAQAAFASGAVFLDSMKQQTDFICGDLQSEINHSGLHMYLLKLIQKETSEG